jgi:tight adherence protein B
VRRLVAAAALLASLAVAGPAAAGVQITSIDTSGYPNVRVTVTGPAGSPAPVLSEDGSRVTGLQAANLGSAKSVVLAVDNSQSMAGAPLADASAAAQAFIAAKAPSDRVEVIAIGHHAFQLTHFSSSTADASTALQQLNVDSVQGTALWDGVALAARGLESDNQPGHVIVVLTDGQDNSSSASFAQAVAAARVAHAIVYTIGVAGRGFAPRALRELATMTGGSFQQASSTSQLAAIYAAIGRALDGTWELSYSTAARPGDQLRLTVDVPGAGVSSRSATVPSLGAGATPSTPPVILPRSAWNSRLAPLVLAAAVGFLVLLACGFVFSSRSGSWLKARLAPHLGPTQRRRTRRRRANGVVLRSLFAGTERAFANVKQFRALQRLLTRADLPLLAAELLYVSLGFAVVLGLLGAAAGVPAAIVLLFMVVGAAVPILWVSFKAGARIKAFDNQLPDLLITIAASLKAGHSFRHAVQAVVDEGAEPAAKEFKRVLNETRLGRPMDDALAEMSDRIGSKNLSFVLTAVTIQRQIGGSLAGLFDMVAETVRQRQQFARKIRSLTAMGRMSAYVLVGLPFLIGLAVTALNPSYMAPLWHTKTGHTLVAVAVVMLAVGSVILKKIVSFRG